MCEIFHVGAKEWAGEGMVSINGKIVDYKACSLPVHCELQGALGLYRID